MTAVDTNLLVRLSALPMVTLVDGEEAEVPGLAPTDDCMKEMFTQQDLGDVPIC